MLAVALLAFGLRQFAEQSVPGCGQPRKLLL